MDNGPPDDDAALGGTHTDHSSPRPVSAELICPGEMIGRYRIVEPLGAGGMGAVYRAHDPDLNRDVAIKVLHADQPGTPPTPDNEKRLLREAQAMAKLKHPNIVTVYDVGTFKGRVFLAMEWIDGTTLKVWLRSTQGGWRQRLDAVLAAGRGLAEAHHADVVHRDFKPDNVLVNRKGEVHVVDFGLARNAAEPDIELDDAGAVALCSPDDDALDLQLTRTGAVLGTPAYMSPEQFHGEIATARSDQFGFAVVAFEALFGRRPFSGVTANEVMRAVSSGSWQAPRPSEVPPGVLEVLARALSPDPASRYPDMRSLLTDLADAATGRAAARPSRMPWVAALLAALAVVTAATAYVVTRDDDNRDEPLRVVPAPPTEPEIPVHPDDLRWPTPQEPPGPVSPPAPPTPPEEPGGDLIDRGIDILLEEAIKRGELGDDFEGLGDDVQNEILREIRIEIRGLPEPGSEHDMGDRIKRRVLERIERKARKARGDGDRP